MNSRLLLGIVVLLLAMIGLTACSSLSKADLANALADLPKNEPLVDAGLTETTMTATLEGTEREVPLTYFRGGPEGAPVIVLVHGTPATLYTWSKVIFGTENERGLIEDFDVIAPEVIGHGIATAETPNKVTFQTCADFVSAVLDHLDVDDATLVGNSYGGEFAWRAALDRPERVTKLVLMSSAGYPRNDDEWLPEEEAMREMRLAKIGWILNAKKRVEPALQLHYHRPVTDELDECFLVCDNKQNWHAMVDLARDENGERSPELKTLSAKTLLLWGSDDKAYGIERFAKQFERDIPDARLQLVEGSGHYPQEEFPEDVIRALRGFVR